MKDVYKRQIQYQYLSGSGYEDRGTAMMSIKFAETLDDLNYTPNSLSLIHI